MSALGSSADSGDGDGPGRGLVGVDRLVLQLVTRDPGDGRGVVGVSPNLQASPSTGSALTMDPVLIRQWSWPGALPLDELGDDDQLHQRVGRPHSGGPTPEQAAPHRPGRMRCTGARPRPTAGWAGAAHWCKGARPTSSGDGHVGRGAWVGGVGGLAGGGGWAGQGGGPTGARSGGGRPPP